MWLFVATSFALRTLVIGGGPVGLSAAMISSLYGPVHVLERRLERTRGIWFDVAEEPWGVGLRLLLEEFKLDPKLFTRAEGVGTVMCRELELALMEKLRERGVEIETGTEWTPDFDSSSYNVIIGADGINSAFRRHHEIQFGPAEGPSHHQQSVLLDFISCPTEAPNFDPSLSGENAIPKISFVFRRFFRHQECHMQVLLSESLKAIPWESLLAVTRQAFIAPRFESVEQLRASLSKARFLNFKVERIWEKSTFRIARNQVGIIMGDASLSAHYRLGIGLNNALNSLSDLRLFLSRFGVSDNFRNVEIAAKNAADLRRVSAVAAFQSSVVRLETGNCRSVLYFEPPIDNFEDVDMFDDDDTERSYSSSFFYIPLFKAYNATTNVRLSYNAIRECLR